MPVLPVGNPVVDGFEEVTGPDRIGGVKIADAAGPYQGSCRGHALPALSLLKKRGGG
jgi:hypothetical protein